jgi:hypothetical protein
VSVNPVVAPHQVPVLSNSFSVIISKAHSSAQTSVTFFMLVRCMLACGMNETHTMLQMLSCGWSVIVAAGFQEVYLCYTITTHSVPWLQNIHFVAVPSSYKFYSIFTFITEISILLI